MPTYAGTDLELTVGTDGTHWRLWAPQAQAARVILYNTGANTPAVRTIDMTRAENGTWTASDPNQLYGMFYTFQIEQDGRWLDETPGVWAKAVGVNGRRAAIIDFSKTDPEGWDKDHGPELAHINDAVIYEMHHRDFSIDPSSGIANKGKFLALTEPSTTNPTGEKTGIDHLKDLGITHVHILPSYDYNSVDEANLPANQYNWGYDPYNYNAPEGSYSTNPSDPSVRVKEMKEMVKA
ncbi:MAG: type I pullulanase, partial [Duncaniella sp.]|nr:type I pullulanase [Duncaniella sp.]